MSKEICYFEDLVRMTGSEIDNLTEEEIKHKLFLYGGIMKVVKTVIML